LARAASRTRSTAETNAENLEAAATKRRRRVPSVVLGLAAGGAAMVYAMLMEKMRFGAPLVMVGLGGMTLVLSAIALWRMIDPLSRAEGAVTVAARAPQRMRELEREKQLVLKAIKEVELDYQMRKIAEGDYREMIERYRARAMRLISEIETGDNYRELIERELKDRLAAMEALGAAPAVERPADAVATARGVCKACDTHNDQDAQFCKKCGAKLESNS
jgi:hypothetical protein